MSNNPIKRGLKVQIEFETGSRKSRIDCYIIKPEFDRLTLSFPESKKEFVPYLCEGTEIKAFIYTFSGIMIIDSIVFDSPFDGKFVIEFNDEHQVIQRRKYLRQPYMTDLYLERPEGNIRTMTIDIGGGGVRFSCDTLLSNMQEFNAQLRLTPFEPMIKIGGFVLKKAFYKEDEYLFEFTQISEKDRNLIIQKCIQIEREQNKKY
ncbi:MAG: PilZ domain-containing protein [Clostridium sp.]|nr:PilZ domain-containing protein [Clostridium sp.]